MSCKQWLSSALRGLARQQQPTTTQPLQRRQQLQQLRLFSNSPSDPSSLLSPSTSRSAFPSRLTNQAAKPSTSTSPSSTVYKSATDALAGIFAESRDRGPALTEAERRDVTKASFTEVRESTRASTTTDAFVRQMPRRWKTGDVYAPRDLSPVEMRKWRRPQAPKTDVVDMFGFNPVDNYRNPALISEFITDHGRIKHSKFTGLRPVNQRKMAKAIRRAIGLGLHPSVHKHPEILARVARRTIGVAYRPDVAKGSSGPKY